MSHTRAGPLSERTFIGHVIGGRGACWGGQWRAAGLSGVCVRSFTGHRRACWWLVLVRGQLERERENTPPSTRVDTPQSQFSARK